MAKIKKLPVGMSPIAAKKWLEENVGLVGDLERALIEKSEYPNQVVRALILNDLQLVALCRQSLGYSWEEVDRAISYIVSFVPSDQLEKLRRRAS